MKSVKRSSMSKRSARINEDGEIRSLYQQLLRSWNDRDAGKFAELFALGGNVVGFDGSQMNGKSEIAPVLSKIFADHLTAS